MNVPPIDPLIDRPTLLRLSAEADCDPRTILAAVHGRPVRGRAGERVRTVLARHGLLPDASRAQPGADP